MTISTTTVPRQLEDGDDVETDFTIDFEYNDDTALISVIHIGTDGTETAWTLDNQYSISSDTVVCDTAPATNEQICIYRNTPRLQSVVFPANRSYSPAVLEAVLDKLTLMLQELAEKADRCLHLAITSDPDIDTELPTPVADKALIWDDDAEAIEYTDP